jgi:hypothetical protein
MSTKERSFWSTTSGVFTGLAGTLTAVVGLVTVGAQLGWFGSDDSGNDAANTSASTTTTIAAATNASGSSGLTGTTTRSPAGAASSLSPLAVNQEKLTFQPLGAKDQNVSVRNTGSTAVGLRSPFVDGVDKSQFTASDLTCGSRLDAGRSCDIKVTYLATKSGKSTARLVIEPTTGAAAEVQLEATSLLG